MRTGRGILLAALVSWDTAWKAVAIRRVFGDRVERDFTSRELLDLVTRDWEVFHLIVKPVTSAVADWKALLRERAPQELLPHARSIAAARRAAQTPTRYGVRSEPGISARQSGVLEPEPPPSAPHDPVLDWRPGPPLTTWAPSAVGKPLPSVP